MKHEDSPAGPPKQQSGAPQPLLHGQIQDGSVGYARGLARDALIGTTGHRDIEVPAMGRQIVLVTAVLGRHRICARAVGTGIIDHALSGAIRQAHGTKQSLSVHIE